MKKAVWIVMLLIIALPLSLCAVEKNIAPDTELKPALENGDAFPVATPLIQQIFEAREQGDFELHEALNEELKQTIPAPPNDAPELHAERVDEEIPILRWGDDVVLFGGDVFVNAWAIPLGIDDEAISVDCHIGDTLIAAVARTDSAVAVIRSYDGGVTWHHIWNLTSSGQQLFEPEVIYARNGHYHIFMRNSYNNGTLLVFNFDAQGNWTAPWITTSADTIVNYTVCSDRSGFMTSYYFYLAFHRQTGGENQDEIDFTRSTDQGETWSTPSTIQVVGSGAPDLSIGNYPYLYLTRWFWNNDNKRVYTRRSDDAGNNWFGSVLVYDDGDSVNVMGPQIACSHDGSQHAWVVFSRQDPYSDSLDYGMGWTRSTDAGATWSSWGYVHSWLDHQEVLPSISVHDGYNDSLYAPYVTALQSNVDWSGNHTLSFAWTSGDTWSNPAESFNDSVPEFTRPIQTWETPGIPAIAYVGEGGTNVYFDAWSVGVEEEEQEVTVTSFGTAHPNPFSARTRIELTIPKSGTVSIKAYNVLGQEVSTIFNGVKNAGTHAIEWKGTDNSGNRLPSGIYFMRIKTPYRTSSKKLILQ
jgi:hypothetical protein